MFYYIIFLLLSPLLLILSLFRKNKTQNNLIIQTAKIGDYVNTSIMIDALKETDILIDQINSAFANHDSRLKNVFIINQYKKSFFLKMKLAFEIFFNNYENVYVVMPNSYNLFLGQMSWARNKVTLSTYADKWYKFLLSIQMKKIKHTTNDLTVDTYLKMINESFNHHKFKKIVQNPIQISSNSIIQNKNFSIGISLTAANKIKTINIETWLRIFSILKKFDSTIYIFGLENEQKLYDNLLQNLAGLTSNIVSLLGKIELKYLPYEISKMNLYISSDTGNSYIADAMEVPTINFAGPCYWQEQRPVFEKSLIVKSNASCVPYSSVFQTVETERCKGLFDINKEQEELISNFVESLYKNFQPM